MTTKERAKASEQEKSGAVLHDNARKQAHQGAFLAAFAKTCRIDRAAEAAGIHRQTHYDWMRDDPAYVVMFEEAKALAHQVLEDAAVDRAVDGWDEPVFHEGKPCGVIRKRSDRLLEVLLRAKKPAEYRDRSTVEHTGKDGAPLIPLESWRKLVADASDDTTP